ncbi:hypothetical protein [Chondromyces crocatus]|uniref:Uncharacterized protein n=1 Tax=Chondromyces crocatus TaxID=52 RepID=A0A0K1E9C8_CHOCO|nr:hypothetical protein [Chondromyces crocatus]AKT37486.1 uncharacterized protein CMC5_016270 [Chondromyces crocatus]
MTTASAPRSRKRLALTLLGITLVGGGVAGASYKGYADEHLHPRPRIPGCIAKARNSMREARVASGTEPWEGPDGQTIYLSEGEYRAATCAGTISKDFGRRVAAAANTIELLPRIEAFADLVRNPQSKQEAAAAYPLAGFALSGMPHDVPQVQATKKEIEALHACRFDTRLTCPTRPPKPLLVWIGGVPAAASAVGLLGLGLVTGVGAIVRRGRRKKTQAATTTAVPAKAPADPPNDEGDEEEDDAPSGKKSTPPRRA